MLNELGREPRVGDVFFRSMEMVLASGQLDWLERMLAHRITDRISARSSDHAVRVVRIKDALAEARVRESLGGPGSLVDPQHYFSKAVERHVRSAVAN